MRLCYRESGAGEAVILLHGLAVNGSLNWRLTGVVRRLRRRFRVIVPDLRGHGRSDRPQEPAAYGLALVHDVRRLLDHLGIRRAHLAGYSLGGFIALKAAETYGDRLCSVTLLASGWESPGDETLFRALAGCADDLRAGRGIRPLGVERLQPGRWHMALLWLYTVLAADRRALAALVCSLRQLTLEENALPHLQPPLCIITGERDYLRPAAERLAARVPGSVLHVVSGAGHLSLAGRRAMHRLLEDFLLDHRCPL